MLFQLTTAHIKEARTTTLVFGVSTRFRTMIILFHNWNMRLATIFSNIFLWTFIHQHWRRLFNQVFLDYFVDLIDNWFIHWHNTCASLGFLNLKYSNDAIVSVLNFFLSFSQWVLKVYGQSGAGFIFTIVHNCIRFTSAIKIYFISKFMYIFWEGILFYRAELIRHSSTTPSLQVFREWNRIGGSP